MLTKDRFIIPMELELPDIPMEAEPSYGGLPNSRSASGEVVSFVTDIPYRLADLKVGIEAVQSGSGDPSPSNVRPISGWTGANVHIFDDSLVDSSAILSRTSIDNTTGEFISGTNYACSNYIDVVGINSVTVYYNKTTSTSRYFKVARYNANKELIDFAFNDTHAAVMERIATIDTSQCSYIAVVVGIVYIDSLIISKVFNTYPISWQSEAGTVYGGTLDVTTGELTVDSFYYEVQGTEGFTLSGSGSSYININNRYPYCKGTSANNGICSHFGFGSGKVYAGISPSSGKYITFTKAMVDSALSISSVAEFNTWLASQKANGTPVAVCYKLATPQTYQLTPTEVMALLGQNNIWADCGDIENLVYFTIDEIEAPVMLSAPLLSTPSITPAMADLLFAEEKTIEQEEEMPEEEIQEETLEEEPEEQPEEVTEDEGLAD